MTKPPMRVSNSEIQTFQDCRRKWYLGYYRKLKKRDMRYTGPLALGSRVHLALEEYYNDLAEKNEESPGLLGHWSKLVAADRQIIEEQWRDTTDFDNEAELGRIMLEGYMD